MNEVDQLWVKKLRGKLRQAKIDYLLSLIALGYVFEQQGMYESTAYWAIHKDYYKTPEERFLDDDFDGTVTPEYFPRETFIRIDSVVVSEGDCPQITQHLLDDDRCYLDYLSLPC